MSTTTQTSDVVKECDYSECDTEKPRRELVDKRFCCNEHRDRYQAQSVFNLLRHDHRFCFSCLSQLKTVSRPTDEQLRQVDGIHSKEAICGFQYQTEKATVGEITAKADTYDTVVTGTICGNCGATDHRDDYFRDYEPQEAAKRLREHTRTLREEGQHDYSFSTKAFVEAWNENTGDWEYALGVALES